MARCRRRSLQSRLVFGAALLAALLGLLAGVSRTRTEPAVLRQGAPLSMDTAMKRMPLPLPLPLPHVPENTSSVPVPPVAEPVMAAKPNRLAGFALPTREPSATPFVRDQLNPIDWNNGSLVGDCIPLWRLDDGFVKAACMADLPASPPSERLRHVRQLRDKAAQQFDMTQACGSDWAHVRPVYLADVLSLVPGARVTFAGDSIMMQTYFSARCSLLHTESPVLDLGVYHDWNCSEIGSPWRHAVGPSNFEVRYSGDRLYYPACVAFNVDKSDVLIFNYGLHYTVRGLDDYKRDMRALFTQLMPWAQRPDKLFVWVETMSQHFDEPRGEYLKRIPHDPSCTCTPRADPSPDEYNAFVRALLRELDPMGKIFIMPGMCMTVPFHQWHAATAYHGLPEVNPAFPDQPREPQLFCDCTHYCYNPFLAETMFGVLADAIVRKWPSWPPARGGGGGV